jgi:hypothetical protein
MPNVFHKDQVKNIVNLIHFPASSVKEEVAKILLTLSSNNGTQLMEI